MGAVVALREEDIRAFQGVAKLDADNYFAHTRTDIAALLPAKVERVLEIGCSMGGTLRWIKQRHPDVYAVGVDGWEGARRDLEKNADVAIIADLNGTVKVPGKFDLILALDILEHLNDPEAVLRDLVENHLTDDGTVIVSLPNFSHYSVWAPLVFLLDYKATDQGVKDRTHRHLTTMRGGLRMMEAAGLRATGGVLGGFHGRRFRLANMLTLGLCRHWIAEQHIVAYKRSNGSHARLRWKLAK